ncbi:RDD family protein [Methanosarcina horonobensis]|uniref:RDD family protein n=1 Tax=Methanosarcina horonobensis TaxID=418008 RepID=UPI000A72861E|nr:RDD family protein [Methanosarcina horonobensis]
MGDWLNTETVSVTAESGKCLEAVNEEKTIEEAHLCDIWKRCAAYLLDILLVNLFVFLILIAATLVTGATGSLAEVYSIAFANLVIFAYFVYFENSQVQATPGKKVDESESGRL